MEGGKFLINKVWEQNGKYYVYDAQRDTYRKISRGLYDLISEKKEVSNDDVIGEEYKSLKQDGFFRDINIEEFCHPLTDSLEYYLNRKLSLVTLQITQDCNLRCSYCPYTGNDNVNRLHKKKYMDIDLAKRTIDYLYAHSIDSEKITIGFYGGEPLLAFDTMKSVVDYAHNLIQDKLLSFTITTNATLMNREILEFLNDNNFDLVISIDGPKEINDANRVFANIKDSVFNKVMENIEIIYREYPDLFNRTTINMVIDPKFSLDKYAELFNINEAMKKIKVQSTVLDDTYKSIKNHFSDEFMESYYQYKEEMGKFLFEGNNLSDRVSYQLGMPLFNSLFERIINGFDEKWGFSKTICPSGPCIPGATRWMVDINGNFFPCERISETVEENVIGNIEEGFNLEKAKFILNIHNLSKDKCINCFAFRHCDGCIKKYEGCISGNEEQLENECNQIRAGFDNILHDIINFNERYGYYGQ